MSRWFFLLALGLLISSLVGGCKAFAPSAPLDRCEADYRTCLNHCRAGSSGVQGPEDIWSGLSRSCEYHCEGELNKCRANQTAGASSKNVP